MIAAFPTSYIHQAAGTQIRKGHAPMASTTVEPEIMITFVLLRDPGQAAMARCLIRAALEHRGLGTYADDTTTIASELVTNAFQHATAGIADKIGVTLLHVWNWEAVGVVVTDPSPLTPVKRNVTPASESGRGLPRRRDRHLDCQRRQPAPDRTARHRDEQRQSPAQPLNRTPKRCQAHGRHEPPQ
jgi:anti-sigma regulatory factor (Ser/Thr protein kinase)